MRPLKRGRPPLVQRESLHGTLVSHIRDMILEGELAPGEQIVEASLCENFGVSRTPLREALKVLSSEGLVELRPRRTPVVAPVDSTEIAATFEVMEMLERLAGACASKRASDVELAELERMHADMVREHDTGNRAAYNTQNRAIHLFIVRLAGNPVLERTYRQFTLKIQRARSTTNYNARRWVESVQEHEQIMEAFRAGNPELVAERLADHTRRTGESVIATLQRVEHEQKRA